MPIDLKDLKAKLRREVGISIGGETVLTVWWAPERFTNEYVVGADAVDREIDAVAGEDDVAPVKVDVVRMVAERMILPLDCRWDVTLDKKPHPMTADTLADLGFIVVTAISRAIQADADAMLDFPMPASDSPDG